MITRPIFAAVSGLAALALCGPASAQGLNYIPPGAEYAAFKNRMEDTKPLVNGLFNQTHIRSTVKRALRDEKAGATNISAETGTVVNGVLVAPTATIEGDLNVLIDLDGDTLVLTE